MNTDAVPAYWEWYDAVISNPNAYEWEYGWRCSQCEAEPPGEYEYPDTAPEFPYCPYCGGKMDVTIGKQIAEEYVKKMESRSQKQAAEQVSDNQTPQITYGIYKEDLPDLRRVAIPVVRFLLAHGMLDGEVHITTTRVDVSTPEAGSVFTEEDANQIFQNFPA